MVLHYARDLREQEVMSSTVGVVLLMSFPVYQTVKASETDNMSVCNVENSRPPSSSKCVKYFNLYFYVS